MGEVRPRQSKTKEAMVADLMFTANIYFYGTTYATPQKKEKKLQTITRQKSLVQTHRVSLLVP